MVWVIRAGFQKSLYTALYFIAIAAPIDAGASFPIKRGRREVVEGSGRYFFGFWVDEVACRIRVEFAGFLDVLSCSLYGKKKLLFADSRSSGMLSAIFKR